MIKSHGFIVWLNVFHLYPVLWWIFSSMCLPCSYLVWPWKELWFKDEPLRFHSLLKPRSSVITQTLHKTFKSIVKTITIIKHFRCPDWCHDSDDGWKWSYGWTRGRRGLGALAGHKVLLRKPYCWSKCHCLFCLVFTNLNSSRSLDNRTPTVSKRVLILRTWSLIRSFLAFWVLNGSLFIFQGPYFHCFGFTHAKNVNLVCMYTTMVPV